MIINVDESAIDKSCYIRKGWGNKGSQLYSKNVFRLDKFNMIAAATSTGELWFTINNGKNNSRTFWNFILGIAIKL